MASYTQWLTWCQNIESDDFQINYFLKTDFFDKLASLYNISSHKLWCKRAPKNQNYTFWTCCWLYILSNAVRFSWIVWRRPAINSELGHFCWVFFFRFTSTSVIIESENSSAADSGKSKHIATEQQRGWNGLKVFLWHTNKNVFLIVGWTVSENLKPHSAAGLSIWWIIKVCYQSGSIWQQFRDEAGGAHSVDLPLDAQQLSEALQCPVQQREGDKGLHNTHINTHTGGG